MNINCVIISSYCFRTYIITDKINNKYNKIPICHVYYKNFKTLMKIEKNVLLIDVTR